MRQRTFAILVLVTASFVLPGCDGESLKNTVGCCLAPFVIGGAIWLVVAIWQAIDEADASRREREEHEAQTQQEARRRALEEAPRLFDAAARELEQWMPHCREVVRREVHKGDAFLHENRPARRARSKSLQLIVESFRPLHLLYENDISLDRYTATEELNRLHVACDRCPGVNSGQGNARCMALDDPNHVQASLRFRREAQR